MFKSLSRSLKTSLLSPRALPTVIGGSQNDIGRLMELLDPGHPLPNRIAAAELIRASVAEAAVSSVPEIWYAAADLVSHQNPPECRRAGWRLLITCIEHDEHASGSRIVYYRAIADNATLEDFDLVMDAVKVLTSAGRDLQDLDVAGIISVPALLQKWYYALTHETQSVRIGRRRDYTLPWKVTMEENFHTLLRFINEVLRFSMSVYQYEDLEDLFKEIIRMCRKTSQKSDIQIGCQLIDTVMTYGRIPLSSLGSVIEILCGIYINISDLQDQAWKSMHNLAQSHVGNLVINTLLRILTRDQMLDQAEDGEYGHPQKVSEVHMLVPLERQQNSNTLRGAAKFLKQLALIFSAGSSRASLQSTGPGQSSGPEHASGVYISSSHIFDAYRRSLEVESFRLALEVTQCVHDLLMNPDFRDGKMHYELWNSPSSPLEVIFKVVAMPHLEPKLHTDAPDLNTYSYYGTESASAAVSTVSRDEDAPASIVALLQRIFHEIVRLLTQKQLNGPVQHIMLGLLQMWDFLDERTAFMCIDFVDLNNYCLPVTPNWDQFLDLVLSHFYLHRAWPADVRLRSLKLLQKVYHMSRDVCEQEVIGRYNEVLFPSLRSETELDVLAPALEFFEAVCLEADFAQFSSSVELVMELFNKTAAMPPPSPYLMATGGDEKVTPELNPEESMSSRVFEKRRSITTLNPAAPLLARSLARMFVRTFRYRARHARLLYYNLAVICQSAVKTNDFGPFIEAARVLFRIRVSGSGYIYLTAPNNMHGLAAGVKRTAKAASDPIKDRANASWWYPDKNVDYIQAEHLNRPSVLLRKRGSKPSSSNEEEVDLDMSVWLNIAWRVLADGTHWEIYSFVLAYFVAQLSNVQLFENHADDVRQLRKALCGQIIQSKVPATILIPKDVTKLDLVEALVRILTMLVGYNRVFAKTENDHIVQALAVGLKSYEKTAIASCNGLYICCYEIPASVKKFLLSILDTFQARVSSRAVGPHVLEFLLSTARLPSFTENLNPTDYRQIFGITFKYIQQATDWVNNREEAQRGLMQYYLATAYSVVSSYFLSLKQENRKYAANFITRNLIVSQGSRDSIDEQSMGVVDLVSRYTYTDVDMTIQTSLTRTQFGSGRPTSIQRWLYGASVLSIETEHDTGRAQFIIRRTTGTTIFNVEPDALMTPKMATVSDTHSDHSRPMFSPSYYMLQFGIPPATNHIVKPVLIRDDPSTQRAIAAIDRTPVVDFHKIGVLYVAPNQQSEQEILANTAGSHRYRQFLKGLGHLARLRGNRNVYTGGLDTENDADGQFAYTWSDKTAQIIYHTTTLMPNNGEAGLKTGYAHKKRHIGNNYVNIYYDESGLPFDFDRIKSQFNFINIVVSPHTFFSSVSETSATPESATQYHVRLYRKKGTPSVFAACHLRVIGGDNIALFVRNLALIANKFATVWHSEGQFVSHWQYRLQQIQRLQERVLTQLEDEKKALREQSEKKRNESGNAFLEQLNAATTKTAGPSAPVDSESDGEKNWSKTVIYDEFTDKLLEDLPLLEALDFVSYTN